jgi:bifunctional non-homologous end joining protein LigD
MGDLGEYRRKRDPGRTPEPVPAEDSALPHGDDDTFVIQEHHATALHWDVRFERAGVLASWAVPKGLPPDLKTIRMAVHTEDHPLEYATFDGDIPKGEYGGGSMFIWDRGTYETYKWEDYEIDVRLHGERVDGRFIFLKRDKGWLVRRREADARPGWQPLPDDLSPMLAVPGGLPVADEDWTYEFKWDGVRALITVDGGRIRIRSRQGNDVTVSYPELTGLGAQVGATQLVLDGEIVAFSGGRPSFDKLRSRMHVSKTAQARRLVAVAPVTYLIFDVLHADGRSCLDMPYRARRDLLESLELKGKHWQTPRSYPGAGEAVLAASRDQELEGVVAKRLDSTYQPGRRSPDWVKITDLRTQEVVIGGWRPGTGKRSGVLGALLLGIPDGDCLRYLGSAGTGFTNADLEDLTARLHDLDRETSPFDEVPADRARGARWVSPRLVGEVAFVRWTEDGRMREPRWRGLLPDRSVDDLR